MWGSRQAPPALLINGSAADMVKSLSVHRNTIERRVRKTVQADMVQSAKSMGTQDVVAYAFVAIKADGEAITSWDTGSALPVWAFPPTMAEILRKDIQDNDVEETWTPSLQERKRPTD